MVERTSNDFINGVINDLLKFVIAPLNNDVIGSKFTSIIFFDGSSGLSISPTLFTTPLTPLATEEIGLSKILNIFDAIPVTVDTSVPIEDNISLTGSINGVTSFSIVSQINHTAPTMAADNNRIGGVKPIAKAIPKPGPVKNQVTAFAILSTAFAIEPNT